MKANLTCSQLHAIKLTYLSIRRQQFNKISSSSDISLQEDKNGK